MPLTREQVVHIAELAKLSLSETEIDTLTRQLSDILDYAARLNELDTDAIPPTASVLPSHNVWREDRVEPSLPREEVLANAPVTDPNHEYFKVPGVLE